MNVRHFNWFLDPGSKLGSLIRSRSGNKVIERLFPKYKQYNVMEYIPLSTSQSSKIANFSAKPIIYFIQRWWLCVYE